MVVVVPLLLPTVRVPPVISDGRPLVGFAVEKSQMMVLGAAVALTASVAAAEVAVRDRFA